MGLSETADVERLPETVVYSKTDDKAQETFVHTEGVVGSNPIPTTSIKVKSFFVRRNFCHGDLSGTRKIEFFCIF